ncbi:hypothetical protein AMECASPLE_004627 [Ameca splendens]|uniref:Uncharacterized protein n=1 Tax=Ameca splendens TaxID=208324 RepID=A0ABV0YA10_9TELE
MKNKEKHRSGWMEMSLQLLHTHTSTYMQLSALHNEIRWKEMTGESFQVFFFLISSSKSSAWDLREPIEDQQLIKMVKQRGFKKISQMCIKLVEKERLETGVEALS